jgi:pimeloyl-ACP methyl ester carboxylesterase
MTRRRAVWRLRRSGARFVSAARRPATVPVLQVQTDSDPVVRWTVSPAPAFASAGYAFELLPKLGHLPAEEDPGAVADVIVPWLRRLAPG